MSSWDMGYNSKVLYTYSYFELLNPLWNKFVLTHAGFAFPDLSQGGYACELGFGQGMSINIHALTSNTEWYGNDFNPAHVKFAKDVAAMGPTPNVHLYDDSFEQFAKRDDLPQFDYIGLHGIWSWISRENQQYIVDFISKHLKIGGVLYISYNVSPGFEMIEPVRYLARQIDTKVLSASANDDLRVSTIEDILIRLMKHSPAFLQSQPTTAQYTVNLLKHDAHYIANEYLNADWDIIHFSDMVDCLDRAKMQFACSNSDLVNFTTDAQKEFLNNHFRNNQVLYEEAQDLIKHSFFRRDLFVKGAARLTPAQQLKKLRQLHFIYNSAFAINDFDYKVKINNREVDLPQDYSKQVALFCCDHKVHSYAEVYDHFEGKTLGATTITVAHITDLLYLLTAASVLIPACDPKTLNPKLLARVKNYNRQLLLGDKNDPNQHFASPICQNSVQLHYTIHVMLDLYEHNPKVTKAQMIQLLVAQTNNVPDDVKAKALEEEQKTGKTLEETVTESVNLFFDQLLPFYKSMQVI